MRLAIRSGVLTSRGIVLAHVSTEDREVFDRIASMCAQRAETGATPPADRIDTTRCFRLERGSLLSRPSKTVRPDDGCQPPHVVRPGMITDGD
jgi:hypothetical protein